MDAVLRAVVEENLDWVHGALRRLDSPGA